MNFRPALGAAKKTLASIFLPKPALALVAGLAAAPSVLAFDTAPSFDSNWSFDSILKQASVEDFLLQADIFEVTNRGATLESPRDARATAESFAGATEIFPVALPLAFEESATAAWDARDLQGERVPHGGAPGLREGWAGWGGWPEFHHPRPCERWWDCEGGWGRGSGPSAVPEPGSAALFIGGVFALGFAFRRRRPIISLFRPAS